MHSQAWTDFVSFQLFKDVLRYNPALLAIKVRAPFEAQTSFLIQCTLSCFIVFKELPSIVFPILPSALVALLFHADRFCIIFSW